MPKGQILPPGLTLPTPAVHCSVDVHGFQSHDFSGTSSQPFKATVTSVEYHDRAAVIVE